MNNNLNISIEGFVVAVVDQVSWVRVEEENSVDLNVVESQLIIRSALEINVLGLSIVLVGATVLE